MAMETLKTVSKQEVRQQFINTELIESIQDDEMEMEWADEDLKEILVSPRPEELEEAIIIGLIFEASNRFRKNGIFLTKRAVRYLQEQGFSLSSVQNEDNTTDPLNQVKYEEETIEEDAMDRNMSSHIPQKRIIYSQKKHKEARNESNLL